MPFDQRLQGALNPIQALFHSACGQYQQRVETRVNMNLVLLVHSLMVAFHMVFRHKLDNGSFGMEPLVPLITARSRATARALWLPINLT